jgi:hypothetical protein
MSVKVKVQSMFQSRHVGALSTGATDRKTPTRDLLLLRDYAE